MDPEGVIHYAPDLMRTTVETPVFPAIQLKGKSAAHAARELSALCF
jgi:hypothetical protein